MMKKTLAAVRYDHKRLQFSDTFVGGIPPSYIYFFIIIKQSFKEWMFKCLLSRKSLTLR